MKTFEYRSAETDRSVGHVGTYVSLSGYRKSFGAPVEFPTEDRDISAYPVVIAPAYELIDADLVKKWTRYVEQGGNLILTARTGQKDRNGHCGKPNGQSHLLVDRIGNPFLDLLLMMAKGRLRWVPPLILGRLGRCTKAVIRYRKHGAVFKPVLCRRDGCYVQKIRQGKRYIRRRPDQRWQVGKGSSQTSLQTRWNRHRRLPEGVYVDWRDGFWVGVNYSSKPVDISPAASAEILLGTKPLKPADVLVWK